MKQTKAPAKNQSQLVEETSSITLSPLKARSELAFKEAPAISDSIINLES